jgi:hypothetical protein
MRISKRMASLLEKAAACFGAGRNPFRREWLDDNEVTFAECVQLSELMGTVLGGFAKSTDRTQAEILHLSAAGGRIPAEIAGGQSSNNGT